MRGATSLLAGGTVAIGGACMFGLLAGSDRYAQLVQQVGLPTAFLLLLLALFVGFGRWLAENVLLPSVKSHLNFVQAVKENDTKHATCTERLALAQEESNHCMRDLVNESKKQTRVLRKLVNEPETQDDGDEGLN